VGPEGGAMLRVIVPRPVVLAMAPLLSTDPVNSRGPGSPLSKLPLSLMSIAPLVSEALVLMVTLPAVATRLRPLSVPSLRKAKSPPIPVLLVKLNAEVFCFLKTPLMADPTVAKVAWRLMMCPNDATPAEIEPKEKSKPWAPPDVISVNWPRLSVPTEYKPAVIVKSVWGLGLASLMSMTPPVMLPAPSARKLPPMVIAWPLANPRSRKA
jgi:hypothetical protein